MNGSVKFTPVQDWMAERGEGFIKRKAAEHVKNLQRFRRIKMQALYNADVYTDEVRQMILESGHIGIEIANRWMMGWPKRVVNLMIQDTYEDVFQNQLLQEQDAIARASNLSHLAPTEIVVMSGLNLEPPEV